MPELSRTQQFIDEVAAQISDPVHKRLIKAYAGGNPKKSMEAELGRILEEVVGRED